MENNDKGSSGTVHKTRSGVYFVCSLILQTDKQRKSYVKGVLHILPGLIKPH